MILEPRGVLHTRQLQELADEPAHLGQVPLHRRPVGRGELGPLQAQAEHRQRRAQLVGGVGGEPPLRGVGVVQPLDQPPLCGVGVVQALRAPLTASIDASDLARQRADEDTAGRVRRADRRGLPRRADEGAQAPPADQPDEGERGHSQGHEHQEPITGLLEEDPDELLPRVLPQVPCLFLEHLMDGEGGFFARLLSGEDGRHHQAEDEHEQHRQCQAPTEAPAEATDPPHASPPIRRRKPIPPLGHDPDTRRGVRRPLAQAPDYRLEHVSGDGLAERAVTLLGRILDDHLPCGAQQPLGIPACPASTLCRRIARCSSSAIRFAQPVAPGLES